MLIHKGIKCNYAESDLFLGFFFDQVLLILVAFTFISIFYVVISQILVFLEVLIYVLSIAIIYDFSIRLKLKGKTIISVTILVILVVYEIMRIVFNKYLYITTMFLIVKNI